MIKNDYMREIENTLKLVNEEVNKNLIDGNLEEAKNNVNKQLKSLVGLDLGTVDVFSFNSIAGLIDKERHYNSEKFIAFGTLMGLQGLISSKENNENAKIQYYEKSVEGFYKAYTEDDEISRKYLDDAVEVSNELSNYELSLELDNKILKIYELANKFDKAEDTLFYMLRKTNNEQSVILNGMRFYNRLKEMDYDKLEEGNLPIAEVEDGILELERRLEL